MPIRKLPTLLVNQIAAGEVIERPASVVKELVENSLDAEASRVEITIEEGGRQLIRIADNGQGIMPDELILAISPHATSKISAAEDLDAIATLGFRGEALASIASVSRLRITSRPTRDGQPLPEAHILEAAGDDITPARPAASSPGTVMEVRDLFFNTPARRKFLRTPATESGHIHDTVLRIAMVHPHVGFTLTHNGRKVLDTPASTDRARRCVDLLGKEIEDGLLAFEREPDEPGQPRVWGMAGLPQLARSNGKGIYLYVNTRPVKDRNLLHAIKEAYRGLIPPDKHPVAVVMLDMDPALVDVNVHPAKSEVRFREPSRMHGLVLTAIRQRLLGADLTPDAQFQAPRFNPAFNTSTDKPSTNDFVDYFKQMDPKQKGFVYQQVREQIQQETPDLLQHEQSPLPTGQATPQDVSVTPQRILQVHSSYVVTEDEQGLVIIDQHALHERMMFEQLTERVLGQGKPLESQRLLMPAVVNASPKKQTLLPKLATLFEKIGMEVEPISDDALAVQAFPSFLFERKVDPVDFLNELLDKAETGRFDTSQKHIEEEALHEVLDMMSCKAAVKAGDTMSQEELTELLAKREHVERASNCPHGRPTTLRLSLKELEKQFGRMGM